MVHLARQTPRAALAALLAAALLSTVAAQDATPIAGCKNVASGAVRLLPAAGLPTPLNTSCNTNPTNPTLREVPVTWNVPGPQGAAGAPGGAGPAGAPGPAGPVGIVWREGRRPVPCGRPAAARRGAAARSHTSTTHSSGPTAEATYVSRDLRPPSTVSAWLTT